MRLEKILRNGQAQSSALNFGAGNPEISLEDTLVVTGVYAAAEILHVNIHSPVMLDRPIQTAAALLDLGDGGRIRQRIGLLGQGGRNLLLIHLGNVLLLMGQTVYQNAARRQVLREAAQAPFPAWTYRRNGPAVSATRSFRRPGSTAAESYCCPLVI